MDFRNENRPSLPLSLKLQRSRKFRTAREIYEFWEKGNFFSADPNSKKKKFSLLIPPPNLTGELHLGHAMQHSILDALARFKRLQGFDVLLLPGVDHAGIQFEATFDKVLAKQNLSKRKLGREKWLTKAWEFKEEVYNSVSKTWRFMGLSADWSREVFTLDPGPQKAVFEEFKTYYEAGLIYKGPYIVQWCPKCNTAIEDTEVEYVEREDKLYYIKYSLNAKRQTTNAKDFITVATVRPETMFADVAVAVSPKDKRYKNLIGEKVVVPFVNREVPIIADYSVDIKFGSGAVKVDPAHDLDDFNRAKNYGLEIMSAVGKDGRLTNLAGQFAGLKTEEAREKISHALSNKGLLEKVEGIKHTVPVCERCKTTTELLISEEWFVKVEDMAREAIKLIEVNKQSFSSNKIKFLPGNYKKILVEWLENIHDWCISRSLWWGHRIPVWYPSTRSARSGPRDMKVSLDQPGPGWVQDEQVLDTWFSSGLWPLSTLGWPDDAGIGKGKEASMVRGLGQGSETINLTSKPNRHPDLNPTTNDLLDRYFPWDFEISAPEIKYLWIARMIMISKYFTGQIPFKTMFFHGMLRDLAGRKFSKSLGNGIEPQYLIDKWGVDATRMALYTYSIPGRDGRVSREILDERGKNFRNFATKIRNIARFVIELKTRNKKQVTDFEHADDKWIRDEFHRVATKVTNNLERLELHLAVEEIYEFVWHEFADKYIEKSKSRREEAQPTLEHVLRQVLILLHPFMPFLTEELYQGFSDRKRSIMLESWPS